MALGVDSSHGVCSTPFVWTSTRLCILDFPRLCILDFPRLCIPLFRADDGGGDDDEDEDEDKDDDDDDDD